MAKKAKVDTDYSPEKATAQNKDAEGGTAMANCAAAGEQPDDHGKAQKDAAAELKTATPKADKQEDVVDLVSPHASPSKAKSKEKLGEDENQDTASAKSAAKRQCVRYNEAQTRKLEALFELGRDKVDFEAVSLAQYHRCRIDS